MQKTNTKNQIKTGIDTTLSRTYKPSIKNENRKQNYDQAWFSKTVFATTDHMKAAMKASNPPPIAPTQLANTCDLMGVSTKTIEGISFFVVLDVENGYADCEHMPSRGRTDKK